jgi:hypothetical protein
MTRLASRSLLVVVVALLGATAALVPTSARADILQPWCLSGGGGLSDHCDFASYAQCQQTAGLYGVCSPNPAFTAPPAPAAQVSMTRRGKR